MFDIKKHSLLNWSVKFCLSFHFLYFHCSYTAQKESLKDNQKLNFLDENIIFPQRGTLETCIRFYIYANNRGKSKQSKNNKPAQSTHNPIFPNSSRPIKNNIFS